MWLFNIWVKQMNKNNGYVSTVCLVVYIHHKRGDKLRVPGAQCEGRGFAKVHMKPLWAVCSRAGSSRGINGPLSPALHGEGGLTLAVNVRVRAVSWSGALGEVLRGSSDLPPS